MNPKTIAAILLIVAGAIALAYQGFSYTTREKAVDLGPLQIVTEEKHTMPIPPILGGIAIIAGVALLVWNPKRS
jgi:drug/metabolite transporter (DMT)-like permease